MPAISLERVDFPDPILPTKATFCPAGILNEILFIVGWPAPSKLKLTFLNSISPSNEGLLIGERSDALLNFFPISFAKFR